MIDERNTSQEWVASHSGISFRTFQNWIYRKRLPDAIETYHIARTLGVSVEYLITGEAPGKSDTSPIIQDLESALTKLKKL
jgi:transcriptional regulator with XRE-family HTH domain